MHYRNLIFAAAFVSTAVLTSFGVWRATQAPPPPKVRVEAAAMHLRLALLVEREQPDGALLALGRDAKLQTGDRVQLTIQAEQAGHLMVGSLSEKGAVTLLYPHAEQTGEVYGEWAYALPAPHQRYTFDGKPMRLVVLLRREAFPASPGERRLLLREALRKGSSARAAHGPVVLTLEDGQPAQVAVSRYSGRTKVLAVVPLGGRPTS